MRNNEDISGSVAPFAKKLKILLEKVRCISLEWSLGFSVLLGPLTLEDVKILLQDPPMVWALI